MSKRRRYMVILEPDEDGWIVAHAPALPGLWTQGKTRDEALAMARDAIEGYIETLIAHGDPVPEEDAEAVEVVA